MYKITLMLLTLTFILAQNSPASNTPRSSNTCGLILWDGLKVHKCIYVVPEDDCLTKIKDYLGSANFIQLAKTPKCGNSWYFSHGNGTELSEKCEIPYAYYTRFSGFFDEACEP
ncbi:hypothetical protein BY458DRAFT_488924 [Sporodiniella umbellata]|nr:hypothetical protein BY458DRAFT_488924 [Sporodiniella umbellata]